MIKKMKPAKLGHCPNKGAGRLASNVTMEECTLFLATGDEEPLSFILDILEVVWDSWSQLMGNQTSLVQDGEASSSLV